MKRKIKQLILLMTLITGLPIISISGDVVDPLNHIYTGTNTFVGPISGNGLSSLTNDLASTGYVANAISPLATTNQLNALAVTSLVVNIRGDLLYDAEGSNTHFEASASYLKDFSTLIGTASTTNSVTGWSYYNGTAFVDLTTNGLLAAYQTPALGMVTYNGFTVSQYSNVYVRVRSWDGTDYSLYEVGYGKGFVNVATFSGGIYSGSSFTNWLGLSSVVYPSVVGMTNDASLQNEVIVYLTNNITMGGPTNSIFDGRTIKYRFSATNGSYTVTWPTNQFRITSWSTMSNIVTIATNETVMFAVEWNAWLSKWMMESFVGGY